MNAAPEPTTARRLKIAAIVIVAILCLPITAVVLIATMKASR